MPSFSFFGLGMDVNRAYLAYLSGMKWLHKLSVILAAGLFVMHGLVPHVHGDSSGLGEAVITAPSDADADLFGFDLGENHLEFALVEAGIDLPAPMAVLLVLLVLPMLFVQRHTRTCAGPVVLQSKLPGGFRGGFFRRPPPLK